MSKMLSEHLAPDSSDSWLATADIFVREEPDEDEDEDYDGEEEDDDNEDDDGYSE
jgi:hypothetical protein